MELGLEYGEPTAGDYLGVGTPVQLGGSILKPTKILKQATANNEMEP